jgi:hypothetical protein
MNTDKHRFLKPPRLQTYSDKNDPFTRLILKDNHSPNLRPVCIKSSRNVKTSRSEEKFKAGFFLPPISPSSKNKPSQPFSADRSAVRTPYFETRNKAQRNLNHQNFTQIDDRGSSQGSNIEKPFEDTFGSLIRNN